MCVEIICTHMPKYNVNLRLNEKLHKVEDHKFRYLYEKNLSAAEKLPALAVPLQAGFSLLIILTFRVCIIRVTIIYSFGATAPPPPPVGQGLLIHELSRSHTTTHHSR